MQSLRSKALQQLGNTAVAQPQPIPSAGAADASLVGSCKSFLGCSFKIADWFTLQTLLKRQSCSAAGLKWPLMAGSGQQARAWCQLDSKVVLEL